MTTPGAPTPLPIPRQRSSSGLDAAIAARSMHPSIPWTPGDGLKHAPRLPRGGRRHRLRGGGPARGRWAGRGLLRRLLRRAPAAVFTDHGDRITVAWPNGRGKVLASPEVVEDWVERINQLRARVAELEIAAE
jgi:hypothetical protein